MGLDLVFGEKCGTPGQFRARRVNAPEISGRGARNPAPPIENPVPVDFL
jgi:hypothetical protein